MNWYAFMSTADMQARAAWKRGKGRSKAAARRRAKRAEWRWILQPLAPAPRATAFVTAGAFRHRVITLS